MGIHAEDARDEEERWDEMRALHQNNMCKESEYCPFCDPDFVPLFTYQYNIDRKKPSEPD